MPAQTNKPLLTRHSHTGERTSQLHFRGTEAEVELLDTLAARVADIPVSRSTVIRMGLTLLSTMVAAGLKPDLSQLELMKRRPPRRKGKLTVDVKALSKAATPGVASEVASDVQQAA